MPDLDLWGYEFGIHNVFTEEDEGVPWAGDMVFGSLLGWGSNQLYERKASSGNRSHLASM